MHVLGYSIAFTGAILVLYGVYVQIKQMLIKR